MAWGRHTRFNEHCSLSIDTKQSLEEAAQIATKTSKDYVSIASCLGDILEKIQIASDPETGRADIA